MSTNRIIVCGSSNMDLISYVPTLPKRGETLRGIKFQTGFGGKGANQAVAAALLGAEVSFVCKVGTDHYGSEMRKNFGALGMNLDDIIVCNTSSTGVASIFVANDGSNCIAIISGANDMFNPDEIELRRSSIRGSKVMLTQLEIKLETTIAALRIAKEEGVKTILNPAPAASLPDEIFKLVDIICPNETELETLSGMVIRTVEDAVAASHTLLQRGVGQVLVTMGEKGSLHVSLEGHTFVPVEKAVQAVDTTGAGDCFLGSLAFFLANDVPIVESMRRANLSAGISVTREGTQTSFPKRHELPTSWF